MKYCASMLILLAGIFVPALSQEQDAEELYNDAEFFSIKKLCPKKMLLSVMNTCTVFPSACEFISSYIF